MSMNTKIVIRGLSLIYKDTTDPKYWKVIFICDDDHKCIYEVDGPTHVEAEPLYVRDVNTTISIDSVKFGTPPTASDNAEIFNLNAPYAHNGDLKRKPHLPIGAVELRIPASTVYGAEISSFDYYIQDSKPPGAPVRVIPPKARAVVLELSSEADVTFGIQTVGPSPSPNISPVLYRPGDEWTLTFNNDCGGNCRYNDFIDLYRVVYDPHGREFLAGRVAHHYRDDRDRGEREITGEAGNCDPVGSVPPPD